MHESSIVRYFTEKAVAQGREEGREEGRQEGAIENALDALVGVLEVRFHARGVKTLRPALEAIEDLQRLKQLHHEALQVPTLEEFAANLVATGN